MAITSSMSAQCLATNAKSYSVECFVIALLSRTYLIHIKSNFEKSVIRLLISSIVPHLKFYRFVRFMQNVGICGKFTIIVYIETHQTVDATINKNKLVTKLPNLKSK